MSDRPLQRELRLLPWRVGRKVGRTIYAVVGETDSDDDVLIGLMDTRELAAAACRAHNRAVEAAALRARRP